MQDSAMEMRGRHWMIVVAAVCSITMTRGARAGDHQPQPQLPLPDGVSGVWAAARAATILGPWNAYVAFVVQPLNDSSGYLISDHFGDSALIPETYQRFWVQTQTSPSSDNGGDSIKSAALTYCGQLATGYNTALISPLNVVRFGLHSTTGNATSVTFTGMGRGIPVDFPVSFTITLLSPTEMRFLVLFGEATHLDVTMTRVGDASVFDNPVDSREPDGGHVCQITAAALPSQQLRPWVQAGGGGGSTGCPFHAQPPSAAVQPKQHLPGDTICVVIQPFINLTMEWVVPTEDATQIAITVSAAMHRSEAGSYFAVGFPTSAFPSMANMTIAAALYPASGSPKVVPMFAAIPYGPPELRDEMPLTNTSATSAEGFLTFSFTRSMKNAFGPIQPLPANIMPYARPRMYFATGKLASNGMIEYHGEERGVFSHEFYHPDAVWSASRLC
jgi:hypothetical protein